MVLGNPIYDNNKEFYHYRSSLIEEIPVNLLLFTDLSFGRQTENLSRINEWCHDR